LVVHYDRSRKEITGLDNAQCKRGKEYAPQELFDPRRSVMTVVPIRSKFWKVTSVLTAQPVPKARIHDVYEEIKKLRLTAPVRRGDIVLGNVCNLGIDVIVTRTVLE
jgi:CxxC motif-containing protein